MAVTKLQKEGILKTLVEKFERSKSVVFAANLGLSVSEISELRSMLREEGVEFQIAKKTLLQKACEQSQIGEMRKDMLDGPVGAAFSYKDEVAAAKVLAKFAKDHKNLVMVAAIVEGKTLNKDEVTELSKIPSKEELIAKLMGSLMAPISGFVGIGSNVIGGLVRTLNGLKEKKEAAGSE